MKETRTRARPLSEEEVALWLAVTRNVVPRPGSSAPELHPSSLKPVEKRASPAPVAAAAPVPPREPALPGLAPLERRARQRLARGRLGIDAAIDLHGLHQEEAHRDLHFFLRRAQNDGAKIVLVVTGKGEGHGGAEQGGVLRRAVPLWLGAAEWRGLVIGFEEAARPHGGAGALYVRIRRRERN